MSMQFPRRFASLGGLGLVAGTIAAPALSQRKNIKDEKMPGVTVSTCAFKGLRRKMEDALFVSPDKSFAAVFDGHGGSAIHVVAIEPALT